MLTQEQINNLNPGDKLALSHPLIFREYDSENDELLAINNGEYIYFHAVDVELTSEHGTSVPTPKHTPCRLFKEGDRAQVVERNGRTPTCFPVGRIKVGDIVTVAENEAGHVFIKVLTEDGHEMMAPWFHLELVTPVEELEPYKVDECGFAPTLYVRKNGKVYMTIPYKEGSSLFQTHEEALAAAEAERDRLNAEWRKEHNNG